MRHMGAMFNRSSTSCKYFICAHKKGAIIDNFGFQVELSESFQIKMAGSSERKSCYIYKRKEEWQPKERFPHDSICDPPEQPKDLQAKWEAVNAVRQAFLGGARPRRNTQ